LGYVDKKYSEPRTPIGSVAELFAGVGGFRIGLSRAGFKTVFSNQWEPSSRRQYASDVYVHNFGAEGHSNIDIASVERIPEDFDILVGGFPCQDYSVAKSAGKASGIVGRKGVLWWEILRLIKEHSPKYIFLENVDRLLKSPATQRGRDFAIMLKSLGNEGYVVEWRVINSAEYGCPQRRIRVFILATKLEELSSPNSKEVLLKTGVLSRAFPFYSSTALMETIDLSDELDIISDSFNNTTQRSPFKNAGVYYDNRAITTKVDAKFRGKKSVLGDVLVNENEVPNEYWLDKKSHIKWKTLKNAKKDLRVHKSGAEYYYSEGNMAFPDSIDSPSRTILTAEGGSSPSRFKHVIKGSRGLRRLVPTELERLNGFPSNWTKKDCNGEIVPDTRRAFLMGNALVIPLIERVGRVLAQDILKEKNG